jgi:FkbH-like protein
MKTKQFNLTSRRYSAEDVQGLSEDPDARIRIFRVTDRLGDNGYVGVFIMRKLCQEEWCLDSLLLSCRVIGRMVEDVMLNEAMELARQTGAVRLVGEYVPSRKNAQTEAFYTSHGFRALGGGLFVRDISEPIKVPQDVEVVRS